MGGLTDRPVLVNVKSIHFNLLIMKQILKQNAIVILMVSFVMLFIGCEKGPNFEMVTYPAPQPTDFNAKSGYPGSYVTITGKDFGTLAGAVTILFNGIPSDSIKSIEDGKIVVKTPANGTTGKITLKIWKNTVVLNGVFTFLPAPTIKSVTSLGPLGTGIAATGDLVVIKGTGFGTDPSKVSVSFNGTTATSITAVADTSIQVITPGGYSSGNLTVKINGFPITGPPLLNPDVKGDISMFYLKNYKQPFSTIVANDASRWRTPSDWTVTTPIMNHTGANNAPAGGLDNNHPPLVIAFESGWGGASYIVNGKMYQTVTLPAGNYTYSVGMSNNDWPGSDPIYIAASAGTTLPDAANISTALGYFKMIPDGQYYSGGLGKTYSCNFSLTQPTKVSLGFVVNMTGNSYLNLIWVKLVLN